MRWPWQKVEASAGGTQQHTATAVAELEARAAGSSVPPETLALAEACIGLWERCLASAGIGPGDIELGGVSAHMLALAGRALALRGNAVFAIRVRGAGVELVPAAFWDIRGTSGVWRYRLDLAGPSRVETVDLDAAAVLHVRIGADPRTPWRGRGPLELAAKTSSMAGRIESALEKESRIPTGRVWRVDPAATLGTSAKTISESKDLFTKAMSQDGIVSMTSPVGVDQTPYGPEPNEHAVALRTALGRDVCAAYGVSPALFSERGDGAGQREAWRRFWLATIAPIGLALETELQAKLHPGAGVTFEALRAADTDGMSRATMRRAQAYKIFREAGKTDAEALRLAGLEAA